MRPRGQIFDLKTFRRDKKLSQKEIAEAVKLPQSFLSAIEHGKKSAPPNFLDDLCRLYNVDNISDYLSEREEEQSTSIEDVKNSVVNSPGGSIIINELGKAFTIDELKKLLIMKDVVKEQIQVASSNSPSLEESSVIYRLIKLLEKSEERTYLADKRIKELEEQIDNLQSRLGIHEK